MEKNPAAAAATVADTTTTTAAADTTTTASTAAAAAAAAAYYFYIIYTFSESASSEIYSSVGPGKYSGYFNGDFTVSNQDNSDDAVISPERKYKGKSIALVENKNIPTILWGWYYSIFCPTDRLACPPTGGLLKKVWTVFSWPISLLFLISIPDCRRNHFRRLYPLTFVMCIVWIGAASYLNAWMMTIIGLYLNNLALTW